MEDRDLLRMETATVALCATAVFLLLWQGVSSRAEQPSIIRITNFGDSIATRYGSDIFRFGPVAGPTGEYPIIGVSPLPADVDPPMTPEPIEQSDATRPIDVVPAPVHVDQKPGAHHHRKHRARHHRAVRQETALRCIPWLPCQYGLLVYVEKHPWKF